MLCNIMPSHKVPVCLRKGTEPYYWNRKIKTSFGGVETAKQIKVIAFFSSFTAFAIYLPAKKMQLRNTKRILLFPQRVSKENLLLKCKSTTVLI